MPNTTPSTSGFRLFSLFGRLFLWLLALCLGLIIIIPVAAMLFFDSNDFKPQLNRLFVEKTGLPLEINGKIELKLFPWVGLNAKNISLSQPQQFGTGSFVQIEEIGFKIPIRELLQQKLIIESLSVREPKIFLIKNTDGTTNFDYYAKQITKAPAPIPPADRQNTTHVSTLNQKETSTKKKLIFALEQFDINHAMVSFTDNASQQNYSLNNINLSGIAQEHLKHYPILATFSFQSSVPNRTIKGEAKIQGDFNPSQLMAKSLLAEVSFQSSDPLLQAGKFTTRIEAQFAEKIIFNDIDLRSGNMHITGNASLGVAVHSPVNFNLVVNQLNLDDFLAQSKIKNEPQSPALHSDTQNSPPPTIAVTNNQNKSATTSRTIKGSVTIAELKFKQLTLTDVNTTLTKENNLLQLNPLTASIYEGKLNAKVTHTLDSKHNTTFQGKATDIELQSLLEALKQQKHITGKAWLDFNLAQNSQNSLNGILQFQVIQGVISGIDLKYYFDLAQTVFSKKPAPPENQKSTPFGSLSGTLKLHDNIIDNNDLQMNSPDFKASGEGSIFLLSQTIEYKLKAWRQSTDTKNRNNDYPLALRIKGPLKHPKVEPDLDLYLKSALGKELTNQLQKQLSNKTGAQDNDATTTENTKDQIKEKVSKELEKGLKKLFKHRE